MYLMTTQPLLKEEREKHIKDKTCPASHAIPGRGLIKYTSKMTTTQR